MEKASVLCGVCEPGGPFHHFILYAVGSRREVRKDVAIQ